VLDGNEVPVREGWRGGTGEVHRVMKKLVGDCSGWRMAGGVFLRVTGGDGGWFCHGDDVPAYKDRRGSMRGFTSFLRDVVVLLGRLTRGRNCWTSWTPGTRR
jgi:hypothetical protein